MIKTILTNLNNRGFKAEFCANRAEARQRVKQLIIGADSVGRGGSATLDETGIYADLLLSGKEIFYGPLSKSQGRSADIAMKDAMNADVYLTSVNAITATGMLVQTDGRANRVGAMIYGPETVIIVAGINKICADYTDALRRIKTVCCPNNARALNIDTPCATGECNDCNHPRRMCNVTVCFEAPPRGKEYIVLLINEELGF